jgi:UDP-N-acetylmuramoyl-L-alanyl-D-glutamate--2,6-diaminopimelate ligase
MTVPRAGKAIAINADDQYGQRLLSALPEAIGFGLQGASVHHPNDRFLHGTVLAHSLNGLTLRMQYGSRSWEFASPLIGLYNASNLLAAQALGLALGLSNDHMLCLSSFTGVPGRLERIANPRKLHVFVDYAHTPDALVNVISAVRAAGFKRIITVFGCGGDRDKRKRPLMGKAVADYADVAVVTSDNPRSEDPLAIIEDILPGVSSAKELHQEPDRKKAIGLAIGLLGPEDALLVAGKGHEDYQIIKGVKLPFSDQETIREYLC